MKKIQSFLLVFFIASFYSNAYSQCAAKKDFSPLPFRVNIQTDSAKLKQIIDNEWVAVGVKKPYAIQYDYTLPLNGKPSYRFELKNTDNTLQGYAENETKGRAELSYCYATTADFKNYPEEVYQIASKKKTVYHYGKGICPQGAYRQYEFSVYIPASLQSDVSAIFAQWHGMPDRTLVQTPKGDVRKLSNAEFLKLYEESIIKKDVVYEKAPEYKNGEIRKDKEGNVIYRADKPSGWLIEQGGYPPLAFGFSGGWFYIKANSDRKWLTDKTDRCNANPQEQKVMHPVSSKYKTSNIAYKMPFENFPKETWVKFKVQIHWTKYGKESEKIIEKGKLNVIMSYNENGSQVEKTIVNNETILIGRNDEDGYYFKFGIYRVGNSKVPVQYNLAGYSEW